MTATQAPTPGPLSATAAFVEAFGQSLDRDFAFWSSGTASSVRQVLYPLWKPASEEIRLAPTAPVEASGSEREHGPKCWGKTSISDEMMYCYCGSTDARPQPSGETREVVLKGVGKVNGDGWKDTTTEGEIVFVWNVEKPTPYAPGQYPRVGNEGWSASTSQYNFTPATADDVPSILALLSARPLALGGQHSTATDFPPDDVLACVNDTTPARAEAQDEGAAGYLVALLASYCGDDTSGCTGETPCLDCVRMANVYKIPKTALGEFVGELGNIAASSPTPAADADRVRIAVEALEKADAAARSGAAMSAADYSISAERLGEEIYMITTPALAALKSEGK